MNRNSRTSARRTKRGRDGFTLIEVMIAAGIIVFGAVGILALQQAATRGNRESREVTTATMNTQGWLERLQRQSLRWTTRSLTGTQNVPYLSAISNQALTSNWFVPVLPSSSTDPDQPGRNYFGAEAVPGGAYYCTMVRLTWLNPYTSMRADVITWWPKDRSGNAAPAACGTADAAAARALIDQPGGPLHAVYGSTVLRWSPVN